MNRRPLLLVLLAFLYCVSPLIYPVLVSLYFGTPLATVAKETLDSNSILRNFETFILPVVLGLATFFAKRSSYFIVVIGSIYLLVRNFLIFSATNDSTPLSGLVFMNLLLVFVIVYLSRKSTRALYFNSKMRWWETDPRYIVGWSGNLARLGKLPSKIQIRNIAIGGAAIETEDLGFLPHEMVQIDFEHGGKTYGFTAGVVWEHSQNGPSNLIGIHWIEAGKKNPDMLKIRNLIQELKLKHTPTTRPTSWWQDFKAWVSRPESMQ